MNTLQVKKILLFNQGKIMKQANPVNSPLGKAFEKQRRICG